MSRAPAATSMLCRQIMRTPVESVRETDNVLDAARRMRDRDVGFLPVCDANGVAVGVLTDRDIVTRGVGSELGLATLPVAALMSRGTVTIGLQELIGDAELAMREHRITRILVVDEDRRPAGVLSLSDIAQYESPSRVGRTLQAVAERKYDVERP